MSAAGSPAGRGSHRRRLLIEADLAPGFAERRTVGASPD